tara:strand:- start:1059 stop:1238 length:180 start_codon:yes stop_codon:yes gene_type:complete
VKDKMSKVRFSSVIRRFHRCKQLKTTAKFNSFSSSQANRKTNEQQTSRIGKRKGVFIEE